MENMSVTFEWLGAILVLAGAVICGISAFGLIRMPDVYLRSHAATKSATLGVLGILAGAFLYFWAAEGAVSFKLLIAILFVFMTSPVAGHLTGRAAYRLGVPVWEKSVKDDLEPVLKREHSPGQEAEDKIIR